MTRETSNDLGAAFLRFERPAFRLETQEWPDLEISDHDFWLLDDREAAVMNYGDAGEFLGAKITLTPRRSETAAVPVNAWSTIRWTYRTTSLTAEETRMSTDDEQREIRDLGKLIADLTEYATQLSDGAQTEVRLSVCDGSGMQFIDSRDLSYWTFVPTDGTSTRNTFVLLRGHAHRGESPGRYLAGVASNADVELQAITADAPGSVWPAEGIWSSSYDYESDSQGGTFTSRHHMTVRRQGDQLQAESLPASRSQVRMEMTVDERTVTGTWMEHTDPAGHYGGRMYTGTILMIVAPDGQSMSGIWTGGDKDNVKVNAGPWTLTLLEASTEAEALAKWNHDPE